MLLTKLQAFRVMNNSHTFDSLKSKDIVVRQIRDVYVTFIDLYLQPPLALLPLNKLSIIMQGQSVPSSIISP